MTTAPAISDEFLDASAKFGPYFTLADAKLRIFSVFDDLKYDRSDADMLSPAMRTHAFTKLKPLGFRQVSGSVLQNDAEDQRVYIPKPSALGASPFDAVRNLPCREQDFVLLTPTQAACQMIEGYSLEEAQDRIAALVQEQPINLYRLFDYLESKDSHQAFAPALGYIKTVQRKAVASEPLCRRRALG